MRGFIVLGALILTGIGPPPPAADAKSAAWLRRDREIIRQMNRRELAKVRRRDAEQAAQNRARRAAYERDMAQYARRRRAHQEQMAAWREAVAACRAGVRSACD